MSEATKLSEAQMPEERRAGEVNNKRMLTGVSRLSDARRSAQGLLFVELFGGRTMQTPSPVDFDEVAPTIPSPLLFL